VLRVSIISPERVLYEGETESLVAPAFDGQVGILTSHAPMMTLLGRGELRLGAGASARRFNVDGGFLQVVDDQVRVVTERAAEA
jgi:F-type H+-transporting ATPase subunit epsilon